MEDEFRLVILFDYSRETSIWREGRFNDTPSAILFRGCNGEMKEYVRPAISPPRHCERSEAIQKLSTQGLWIASLRSQ